MTMACHRHSRPRPMAEPLSQTLRLCGGSRPHQGRREVSSTTDPRKAIHTTGQRTAAQAGPITAVETRTDPQPYTEDRHWSPGVTGRPRLFLAPMEGLGDKCFRAAISAAFPDSFDEASTEFLRITLPDNLRPDSRRAAKCFRGMFRSFGYDPQELSYSSPSGHKGAPIALQLMLAGDQGDLGRGFVEWMFSELDSSLHPHRLDINMGCPSKCTTNQGFKLKGGATTRRGAGSSLLRDPRDVEAVTRALREGIGSNSCCLSVKMRTGFDDEALFQDNLLAAATHADFVQIHGRTKADGYKNPARWEKIQLATEMLRDTSCRVVGNGDLRSAPQVQELTEMTGVDGVMIGRAAVANPFLFYEIRSHYGESSECRPEVRRRMLRFFEVYYSSLEESQVKYSGTARYYRTMISRLKKMVCHSFTMNPEVSPEAMVADMSTILRSPTDDPAELYDLIMQSIDRHIL